MPNCCQQQLLVYMTFFVLALKWLVLLGSNYGILGFNFIYKYALMMAIWLFGWTAVAFSHLCLVYGRRGFGNDKPTPGSGQIGCHLSVMKFSNEMSLKPYRNMEMGLWNEQGNARFVADGFRTEQSLHRVDSNTLACKLAKKIKGLWQMGFGFEQAYTRIMADGLWN